MDLLEPPLAVLEELRDLLHRPRDRVLVVLLLAKARQQVLGRHLVQLFDWRARVGAGSGRVSAARFGRTTRAICERAAAAALTLRLDREHVPLEVLYRHHPHRRHRVDPRVHPALVVAERRAHIKQVAVDLLVRRLGQRRLPVSLGGVTIFSEELRPATRGHLASRVEGNCRARDDATSAGGATGEHGRSALEAPPTCPYYSKFASCGGSP